MLCYCLFKRRRKMKDNDSEFISKVADYFCATVDDSHPHGNMSAVAEHFGVTRAKVNKILITAGVIDSPLHRDVMRLKEDGYDTSDIAVALGVSEATVKINMPYEKVIYKGEEKSPGAVYVDQFRKREKVFLENVVRAKTNLEEAHERIMSNPEHASLVEEILKNHTFDNTDDPLHLSPIYTEDEYRLFKMFPYLLVLHVELDGDLSEIRKEAELRFGRSVSRDILVPAQIPLHNLHYCLNQAFGFTHSHLHEFTLPDEDLEWITGGKVSRWKDLVGLVFKNPYRDEELDYWDDDYEGGSPKKWMRSKYTGPEYRKVYEESYPYIHKEFKDEVFECEKIDDLWLGMDFNPLQLNESLPLNEILSVEGHSEYKSLREYDALMKKSIEEASRFPEDTYGACPYVYPFASSLKYTYDFGDDWSFTITPHENVEYLGDRVTAEGMKKAIRSVLTLARPMVIAADGLPLIEDAGGIWGLTAFYKGEEQYEDRKESIQWAKGNGWSGKIGNLDTLL
jgi:hypothetical protein